MTSPPPSEGPKTVSVDDVETHGDDRPTIVDGLRGENVGATPLKDLAALPRPLALSAEEEDTEPTRPAAFFAARLAYWDAHDADFSPKEAEDELPCVLALRKI